MELMKTHIDLIIKHLLSGSVEKVKVVSLHNRAVKFNFEDEANYFND